MIYVQPGTAEPIDQGDLIDGCPLALLKHPPAAPGGPAEFELAARLVIVLTQTCDLANDKVTYANVAEVFIAQALVDGRLFKPADIKGQIRSQRVWGWYFLPADRAIGLGEMVIEFRRLHTVRVDLLTSLARAGQRLARVQPLYREHLAKHFGDTFSRIGLPRPYETL